MRVGIQIGYATDVIIVSVKEIAPLVSESGIPYMLIETEGDIYTGSEFYEVTSTYWADNLLIFAQPENW